mgnify:FL=1
MANEGTINHLNRERTWLHDEKQALIVRLNNEITQRQAAESLADKTLSDNSVLKVLLAITACCAILLYIF